MLKACRIFLFFMPLVPCLGQTQQGVSVPQMAVAPVPPALLSGKIVFLSNAGADAGLFPHPFSGDTARAYNYLYTALSTDPAYQLTQRPAQADLVFEIRLTAPYGPSSGDKAKGASDPLPMFRLVVYDRATHYVLWAVTESIKAANIQKTHDRNFDMALDALLQDLKTAGSAPH